MSGKTLDDHIRALRGDETSRTVLRGIFDFWLRYYELHPGRAPHRSCGRPPDNDRDCDRWLRESVQRIAYEIARDRVRKVPAGGLVEPDE